MASIVLGARNLVSTDIKKVAKDENISVEFLSARLLEGTAVILKNNVHKLKKPLGVGKGLRTKVNANIGTSPAKVSLENEKRKLEAALRAGVDAVMDLSIGGDITAIRRMIMKNSTVPVGTVPLYQVACETVARGKKITEMDTEHMFEVIEQQAEEGVDFMTVHCGVTKETVRALESEKRLVGVVSRGGAFTVKWIKANKKENPFFEQYSRLLKIAAKYSVTLSLGDGLRPGCLADSSDSGQLAETSVLGKLVDLARRAGVQVIVEGPGHMPLDQIQTNVQFTKQITKGAPLYLLGPLVTDVAAGYDHITGAIGGAIAASAGADFLCYVTPSEHISLPDEDDVYQGVIASRIAGHAADIVKKVPGALEWDNKFSKQRKALDWKKQEKLALDPHNFKLKREKAIPLAKKVCTMCGEFCAMKD